MTTTYGEKFDSGAPIAELFDCVLRLHKAVGAEPVRGRVWRHTWTHEGRDYELLMNGCDAPVESVPPLHVMVSERDGFPLALFDMFGGSVMAPEDRIIAALESVIAAGAVDPQAGVTTE